MLLSPWFVPGHLVSTRGFNPGKCQRRSSLESKRWEVRDQARVTGGSMLHTKVPTHSWIQALDHALRACWMRSSSPENFARSVKQVCMLGWCREWGEVFRSVVLPLVFGISRKCFISSHNYEKIRNLKRACDKARDKACDKTRSRKTSFFERSYTVSAFFFKFKNLENLEGVKLKHLLEIQNK